MPDGQNPPCDRCPVAVARCLILPVAIASGRIEDRQAEELDRLNVTARLGKPFTRRRLMAVLDQLLVIGAANAR